MLTIPVLISLLAQSPATAPASPIEFTARMPAVLEVGGSHEIAVELTVADGWSISKAGMPVGLLQIQSPASATLEGEATRKHKSESLGFPAERALEAGAATIPFTLNTEPDADERVGLVVLAYVSHEASGRADFIRERFELPIRGGATAVAGNDRDSSWGPMRKTLQIGDRADDFTLPRADGSSVSLRDLRGRNVLVTTYRAFW